MTAQEHEPNPRSNDADPGADPALAAVLRRLPVPPPPAGLFDRALANAARERDHARDMGRHRFRWLATGFGGAVAAGAVMLLVGGLLGDGTFDAMTDVPTVSMSLYEPETVKLVFSAESPLDDATMTVLLPEGIELEGFPGEREIRWETSLAAGRNLLPLTLVATAPAGGDLLARLEHDSRDRTFRLHIDIG